MKTKAHLRDGSCVTIKSVFERTNDIRRGYSQKINAILEKYNKDWIGNESDIDMSVFSEADCQRYNELFEARAQMSDIAGQLSVLANSN